MRTGMFALALGLLALRFLPALPQVGWLLVLPVVVLMMLPFRTYPLAFFCWVLAGPVSVRNGRWMIGLSRNWTGRHAGWRDVSRGLRSRVPVWCVSS